MVCGANKLDYHLRNVTPGRDFTWTFAAEIRSVNEGEGCPTENCGGKLVVGKAVEVGHIFKLGYKYSESMGARVLDENGKEVTPIMGSYGIGIERILTAAIEQSNDANGFWLPASIAPFTVVVTITNVSDIALRATGEKLAAELEAAGLDVLLDDRDERAGVKFKDADLVGIPYRINVGKKAAAGQVELVTRATSTSVDVALGEVVALVKKRVEEELLERLLASAAFIAVQALRAGVRIGERTSCGSWRGFRIPNGVKIQFAAHQLRSRILLGLLIAFVARPLSSAFRSSAYFYIKYEGIVDERLKQPIFASTAKIYAAPREVRPGQKLTVHWIANELREAGYSSDGASQASPLGTYSEGAQQITVQPGPQSYHAPDSATIHVSGGVVDAITDAHGQALSSYELEPLLITGLSEGAQRTKRRVLTYDEIPPNLVHAVIAIEDRRFFEHSGIDYWRILGAHAQ